MSISTELYIVTAAVLALSVSGAAAPMDASDWLQRFSFVPPVARAAGKPVSGSLGLPTFSVTPSASGKQIVRVSLPFPCGAFPGNRSLTALSDKHQIAPDVRVLTTHPGTPKFVRRAIVTFPYEFAGVKPVGFRLSLRAAKPSKALAPGTAEFTGKIGATDVTVSPAAVWIKRAGRSWRADLIAPARTGHAQPRVEVIEHGQHYLWVRLLVPDAEWPRITEVRADSLGSVAVRAHLQWLSGKDGYAPEFGWRISGPAASSVVSDGRKPVGTNPVAHAFDGGSDAWVSLGGERIEFPDAHLLRRGGLSVLSSGRTSEVRYLRSRPDEKVPMQDAAWRGAAFAIVPAVSARLNAMLEPPHTLAVPTKYFDAVYACGPIPNAGAHAALARLLITHRDWIAASALQGDDCGSVTGFPAGAFGMNRLNHCPPIFDEYYRSSDPRLRETAVQWCSNFHDLSIWWGTNRESEFGGTRYNNVQAMGGDDHKGDSSFMWRSNSAVHFCTKGYDSFLYAYEETGDPRMATDLRWQTDYAKRMVHTDQGECRNIGDALDFVRLYRFTGDEAFLDSALRLFRELRTKLGEDNLFSQGGQPIEKDPPFIDDDALGYQHPFAKPYIIGYALAGLPELARLRPEEPRLRDTVRAVGDFLARSQDPTGGWRYPHPASRALLINQGIEHAAQMCRAASFLESRGEPIDNLLDAVERTLQARVLCWQRSGQILGGLGGWEDAAGVLKGGTTVYDLYRKPADRDPSRDYTEGSVGLGYSAPEGIVYFPEVLRFYLSHRPAERLFKSNELLEKVLMRVPDRRADADPPAEGYLKHGMAGMLPTFTRAQVERLTFPLAYDPKRWPDFAKWRTAARKKLLECLQAPPPAPSEFSPALIAEEDRGSYTARKLVFSVSADCRVPAYLLVPKGKGPFPAVIALHDHGAHFPIGKEKVVRPFEVQPEVLTDAEQWAKQSYGGRFIGDELAKRGYVVFAMDALFWGERGRLEGVSYEAQQELAANLLQLGMCWAGVITWDDVRSAEFVASLPEVDPKRIGAVGLSMGSHRAWTLCAASDRIAAGAAICWMSTTKALMVPGNNQTKGQSAFSMLVPGLRNHLDYPDVASVACPKPMLFFNGRQDGLFPIGGVEAAYARMRRVWDSQNSSTKLLTKLWDRPHVFDVEMQNEAFDWLDAQLRRR